MQLDTCKVKGCGYIEHPKGERRCPAHFFLAHPEQFSKETLLEAERTVGSLSERAARRPGKNLNHA